MISAFSFLMEQDEIQVGKLPSYNTLRVKIPLNHIGFYIALYLMKLHLSKLHLTVINATHYITYVTRIKLKF